ncbi:hypothetical protein EDD29_8774 [Actinocorallia herbida]|uniref:Uncharacterized protein n=1 Tax=Actinocorallia herbida TaxID=58109 RepID=A0A3N1DBY2_9ACTN|nr:hypothetical protein EDD29_8774 [Actinocorallia herbida]
MRPATGPGAQGRAGFRWEKGGDTGKSCLPIGCERRRAAVPEEHVTDLVSEVEAEEAVTPEPPPAEGGQGLSWGTFRRRPHAGRRSRGW